VKQVGRELGVRYVLEGSLRKSGSRTPGTAQLVEAETGKHVWAERYDRNLADIFAVQDEIAQAVTIAVAPAIADAELHRAMRRPPDSLDAWAAYQRALWHLASQPAWSLRGSEGSAGQGDHSRAGLVRDVCLRACALASAGRPRTHARRSTQSRLARLKGF
jgi:hypothetical protein